MEAIVVEMIFAFRCERDLPEILAKFSVSRHTIAARPSVTFAITFLSFVVSITRIYFTVSPFQH